MRGDRFNPDFVEKRRASLERFLKKLAVHPVLQRAESLRIFLESRDWSSDLAEQNKKRQDEGRLDTIGDALLNAFAKIKKPEEKFVIMRDEVDKLEENLQGLEKLEQRILKRQEELEGDYREFGGAVAGLGNLETGLTEPLHRFAHTVASYATIMNELVRCLSFFFLTSPCRMEVLTSIIDSFSHFSFHYSNLVNTGGCRVFVAAS